MAHNTSFVYALDAAVACDFEGFVAAQRALRLGLDKFFGDHDVQQEHDRVQVLGRALFALATETGTVRVDRAFTGVRTLDQLLRLGAAMIAAKIRGTGEQMEHLAPHFDRALQAALADHDAQRNCDQTVLLAEAAEEESSPDPADPEAQEYGRQVRDLAAEMFAEEQAAEIRQLRARLASVADADDLAATQQRLEEFVAHVGAELARLPAATVGVEEVAVELRAVRTMQEELREGMGTILGGKESAALVGRVERQQAALKRHLDEVTESANRATQQQQARAEQRLAEVQREVQDGLQSAQQEQREEFARLRREHELAVEALRRGLRDAKGNPAEAQLLLADTDRRMDGLQEALRQVAATAGHASPETRRRLASTEQAATAADERLQHLHGVLQNMQQSQRDLAEQLRRSEAAQQQQAKLATDALREVANQLRREFSASRPLPSLSPTPTSFSASPATPFVAPAGSASPAQEEGAAVAMLRQQRREQSELAASSGPLMAAWLDDDELLQRQLAQLPRYTWKKSPLKAGVGCPWPQLLRAVATEAQKQRDDGDNWRDAALKRLQAALDRKNRGSDKPFALSVGQLEWLEMAAADRQSPWHFAELCGVWALAPVKEWDAKLGMLRIARRLPHAWTASERAQHASGTLLLPLPVSGGSVTFETKQ